MPGARTSCLSCGSFRYGSRETDQVVAGQGSTDLLHPTAITQAAEVDDEEAGVLEHRDDLGLGQVVVTGQEDHPLATRLAGIGTEYGGPGGVGGRHPPRGGAGSGGGPGPL